MTKNRAQVVVGVLLVLSALALFGVSIYLAVEGYIVAGLLGASIGSLTLIVGADLVRSEE